MGSRFRLVLTWDWAELARPRGKLGGPYRPLWELERWPPRPRDDLWVRGKVEGRTAELESVFVMLEFSSLVADELVKGIKSGAGPDELCIVFTASSILHEFRIFKHDTVKIPILYFM